MVGPVEVPVSEVVAEAASVTVASAPTISTSPPLGDMHHLRTGEKLSAREWVENLRLCGVGVAVSVGRWEVLSGSCVGEDSVLSRIS